MPPVSELPSCRRGATTARADSIAFAGPCSDATGLTLEHRQEPSLVLRTLRALSVPLFIVWASSWGCAQRDVRLGETGEDAGDDPRFTPIPGEGDASTDGANGDPPVNALMCIGTECPEGFETCPGSGVGYKCGVDLSRDPNNCGTCGNKCLYYASLHMNSRCVDGQCELECYNDVNRPGQFDMRNCNGAVDDGCEVNVLSDTQNCGACGKQCAAGDPCIKGRCGCPAGYVACTGANGKVSCVDTQTDDFNCGSCGHACTTTPADACNPMPLNTYYGCGGGVCDQIKCGGSSADCNQDLGTLGCQSDGCEVADLRTDRNNCGGCGIKCAANEQCIDEGYGYECAVPCARFGMTKCKQGCFDLLNDPNACGGCESRCRNAGPNEVRSCKKGLCAFTCLPGFADCNGDESDGCEVNLKNHPESCGACGNRCYIAAGQPCVDGKCLMAECDGGLPPQ